MADKLRMKTKLAFGIGSAAEAGVHIAFNTWSFLYYNNVLGLSGTLCGLAITIALVFDAMSDPLVGSISDRWRSRLGRRHPFLYAAPIPLALFFFAIYSPPASVTGFGLFLWLTVFTILLRTALTLYHVPHLALGAELSRDYRERTVVMAYNGIFQMAGGVAVFFFGWTWFARAEGGTTERLNFVPLGIGVALIGAAVIFASAHFTRDRIPYLAKPADDHPPFSFAELLREILAATRNRNYLTLLLGLVFLSATFGTRETINAYMGLFYWELGEKQIRLFGVVVIPAYFFAFVLAPRLHARFDKREAIIGSVVLVVFAATIPILARIAGAFPPNGAPGLLPALLGFHATFYVGVAILTMSVMSALADIADEHELTTGRRQEGIFYSARTFFAKVASGLGHLIAGLAIDIIGFPKEAKPGEVPADVVFNLGLLDGPIASLPAFVAIAFYARYRIDKRRHAEVQQALAARHAVP